MNEQRTKVFLDRYALKGEDGLPVESTLDEMWHRVAKGIATSDAQAQDFYGLLKDFKFVPGGRILAGAGTNTEVTYYNCYVIPIETRGKRQGRGTVSGAPNTDPGADSRESILDTISVMVDIMSRGGGVGINWSVLRPKGTHLSRVNGTTSGPVSWMDVASHAVQTVTQGGSRRGAAMFMLDDWHPDVLEFIDAKRNLDKITGANVSVAISDGFMRAVEMDADWNLMFPDTKDEHYNTEWDGDMAGWIGKGYGFSVQSTVKARDLWHKIAEAAWHNGEPGIVFLERYNEQSTGRGVERIICVNPCGEQGLGPYSVCNLGSMNLDAYVYKRGLAKFPRYDFDWDRFMADAETATEFLDNVIDSNFYFLPENEAAQKSLRRIGLGVMGLADAMLALGIRYGSQESVDFTDRVFRSLKVAAVRRSVSLAIEKGAAPAWDKRETWKRPYFKEFVDEDTPLGRQVRKYGLRNMFLLTQAPTGSTSILAGVNSGIEPYFAFEYTRVDRTGTHKVLASAVEKYKNEAVVRGPEWVTSNDVTVEEHIAVQAAVQRHVDSSVSKTVNGPNSHTVEDVEKLFRMAYDSGLKGVAYFRDGNGRDQVLYKEEPKDVVPALPAEQSATVPDAGTDELLASLIPYAVEYVRPDVLSGSTSRITTRAGTAYVTVNRDASDGRPVEVFFNVGKAGSEVAALAEALGRLASLSLRKGATLGGVANQLEGVGGSGNFNKSIAHAISEALTAENARRTSVLEEASHPEVSITVANPDGEFEFRGRLVSSEPQQATSSTRTFDICPECHNASLMREEGCSKCALCGYSAC